MEESTITIEDLKGIVRRRRWSILLPLMLIFGCSVLLAVALPRTYRSTSTMLIESRIIPKELVDSMESSFAEQRLQSINQRVMSTTKLLEIIGRYKLYDDLKNTQGPEEIANKMRKDIKLETISAEVIDPRSGNSKATTIAFSLSYRGKSPSAVQQIANVLASLYLEENLKVGEQQTTETTKFLEEEMKEVQVSLTEVDARIAAFKEKNIDALPELSQANLQWADRLDTDIERQKEHLRSLMERENYLRAQLALVGGGSAIDPDRLRAIRKQQELREKIKEQTAALNRLKPRLPDDHPDVVKIRKELAALEKQTGDVIPEKVEARSDDPLYVTLDVQLAATRMEIDSVKRQIDASLKKIEYYRSRITASPRVEQVYKQLISQRTNLQLKHDELMKKFMDSKVAHSVEKEQMGERFTLIDAARFPEKPVSPNIPAILLMGLVLGIGCGVGLATIQELSDKSFKTPEALYRATGIAVLASIPEIVTAEDTARTKSRRKLALIGAVLALATALLLFNFFVMDLEIFWGRLSRRIGF